MKKPKTKKQPETAVRDTSPATPVFGTSAALRAQYEAERAALNEIREMVARVEIAASRIEHGLDVDGSARTKDLFEPRAMRRNVKELRRALRTILVTTIKLEDMRDWLNGLRPVELWGPLTWADVRGARILLAKRRLLAKYRREMKTAENPGEKGGAR